MSCTTAAPRGTPSPFRSGAVSTAAPGPPAPGAPAPGRRAARPAPARGRLGCVIGRGRHAPYRSGAGGTQPARRDGPVITVAEMLPLLLADRPLKTVGLALAPAAESAAASGGVPRSSAVVPMALAVPGAHPKREAGPPGCPWRARAAGTDLLCWPKRSAAGSGRRVRRRDRAPPIDHPVLSPPPPSSARIPAARCWPAPGRPRASSRGRPCAGGPGGAALWGRDVCATAWGAIGVSRPAGLSQRQEAVLRVVRG